MFNELDESFLEELHLEKDLRRYKRKIYRILNSTCKKVMAIITLIGVVVASIGIYYYRKECINRKNK